MPQYISDPLPESWQSPITGQVFHAFLKWWKPEIALIDWRTTCRRCGEIICFSLPDEYSEQLATKVSVRWFGLCSECRKERTT